VDYESNIVETRKSIYKSNKKVEHSHTACTDSLPEKTRKGFTKTLE